ncbi:tudor domain-containing protein 3 [Diabrotica virgifera virgifera]|uniref:Tudor domain-containing protein n=1 Tax=Diabrotica virgifera virgifera TaxID=50390 RepID=A0ABM5IGF5_DIAVI|nr:tudor domain-containing protein 3 [Diabrotica virgifera virgifera]
MATILGNEWHISSKGNEILTGNVSTGDKQQIYNFALNTDLKEICSPIVNSFPIDATSNVVLQIHKIRNISAPKANEDSQAAPRMLKITLTDGENYIQALELTTISTINYKTTPPGTKLLVQGAKLTSGFLLLNPQNCKVLGGKVANLIEKWELAKNVQKISRNYNEDGPPPWVNFGTKIQTGNQGENFKSLTNKEKEALKENSEFEQLRKDAIAEASSGAVRKVFSGRVTQNVQLQNNTNKRNPERTKEKKEPFKGKGRTMKEVDDKPQKPSEKVSLFAFLEDKLPVATKEEKLYQSQPIKNNFRDPEVLSENINKFDKYDHKYKKTQIVPKQFEKPTYNNNRYQSNKETNNSRPNTTEASHQPNKSNLEVTEQKPVNNAMKSKTSYTNRYESQQQKQNVDTFNKPKQSNNNFTGYNSNNQNRNHQQQNSNSHYSQYVPHNSQPNAFQPNNVPYNIQNSHPNRSNNQYSHQNPNVHNTTINVTLNNHHHNQQIPTQPRPSTNPSRPYQNDVNHITQETQRMSINSQFASRSLRQHLNLNPNTPRKNEDYAAKGEDTMHGCNVGDEVLAKYWEDGKYYNATVISVTPRTFAVRFKGYGNIEEILKTDCLPVPQNNARPSNNQNQQYDYNKQYSGSMEFRRSSRYYK